MKQNISFSYWRNELSQHFVILAFLPQYYLCFSLSNSSIPFSSQIDFNWFYWWWLMPDTTRCCTLNSWSSTYIFLIKKWILECISMCRFCLFHKIKTNSKEELAQPCPFITQSSTILYLTSYSFFSTTVPKNVNKPSLGHLGYTFKANPACNST